MVLECRPRQTLSGKLVQETLQKRAKVGAYVVGKFDGILYDQVDKRVDVVGVEGGDSDK